MSNRIDFQRVKNFIRSIGIVAKTCGYNKAIRRAIFILLQRLFVSSASLCIKTKLGYRMYLIPNDPGISTELRLFKIHEPLTTKILTEYIQNGWTILDVGSNIGYYALLESQLVGEKGKVIAIEPMPLNYSYLIKNIRLNKVKNVLPINCAISNKNGKIKMIKSSYSNWCSVFTGKIPEIIKNDNYSVIEIPTKTIDSIVKELHLKYVNLIRMDIEGHELEAIKGGIKTIKKYHPDLLIEIHTKYLGKQGTKKLLNLLENEGYRIKWGVVRDVDFCGVGSLKDIKAFTTEEVVKLKKNDIMVYLTSRNRGYL